MLAKPGGLSASSRCAFHGEILESVVCAHCLWVSIFKDLGWNAHVGQIASKASRALGFVERNVGTKSRSVRGLACGALVVVVPWLLGGLGCRRYDSRLAMFYKMQYSLVAVSMPLNTPTVFCHDKTVHYLLGMDS